MILLQLLIALGLSLQVALSVYEAKFGKQVVESLLGNENSALALHINRRILSKCILMF